jgi:hypothetical protein
MRAYSKFLFKVKADLVKANEYNHRLNLLQQNSASMIDIITKFGFMAFPHLPGQRHNSTKFAHNDPVQEYDELDMSSQTEVPASHLHLKETIESISIPAIRTSLILHFLTLILFFIFFLFYYLYLHYSKRHLISPINITCQLSRLLILNAFVSSLSNQFIYQQLNFYPEFNPYYKGKLSSLNNVQSNDIPGIIGYILDNLIIISQSFEAFRDFELNNPLINSIHQHLFRESTVIRFYEHSHSYHNYQSSIQGFLTDYVVQLNGIARNSPEVNYSQAVNNSIGLNSIYNGPIIDDTLLNVLSICVDYFVQEHSNWETIHLIFMIFGVIIFIPICIFHVIFQNKRITQ